MMRQILMIGVLVVYSYSFVKVPQNGNSAGSLEKRIQKECKIQHTQLLPVMIQSYLHAEKELRHCLKKYKHHSKKKKECWKEFQKEKCKEISKKHKKHKKQKKYKKKSHKHNKDD